MAVATEKRPEAGESPKPAPHPHEEKKPRWMHYSAVTTVVIAVFATLAALRVASNSNKAILSATKAANSWSYFQSKSIKEHNFELQRDELLLKRDEAPPERTTYYDKKLQGYEKKLVVYDKEKNDITAEAKKFESDVDKFRAHAWHFTISVTFLQIAILTSSIGAQFKKGPLWASSLVLGIIGIFFYVEAFFLFLHV